MHYFFKIADVSIHCITPIELMISEESLPFLVERVERPADITMHILPVSSIELPDGEGVFQGDNVYYTYPDGYRNYYCAFRNRPPFAEVIWTESNPQYLQCNYVAGQENRLNYTGNIIKLLGLETLLLMHKVLLLHSSFIKLNGEAILFTAPSGTGKSTQAELWKRFEAADILNGDRAGLRKMNDIWTAWGLPYAGSSGIYRNESAPIKSIVVLRQARENKLMRLGIREAIRYIYPELTIHRWEQEFVEKALDLLTKLVTEVPVYLLSCLPNQEAVQILKEALWGKGGEQND